jgi:hypothetical protein
MAGCGGGRHGRVLELAAADHGGRRVGARGEHDRAAAGACQAHERRGLDDQRCHRVA